MKKCLSTEYLFIFCFQTVQPHCGRQRPLSERDQPQLSEAQPAERPQRPLPAQRGELECVAPQGRSPSQPLRLHRRDVHRRQRHASHQGGHAGLQTGKRLFGKDVNILPII